MSVDNKNRTNKSYSVEDLLQDDCFIAFVQNPTKESEEYWSKALEKGRIDMRDYELACFFVDSVQVQSDPISSKEIFNLWEDIEVKNKQNLKRRKKRFRFYATTAVACSAALFAFLFSLYSSMDKGIQKPDEEVLADIKDIKAPDAEITDIQLVLTDNETLTLEGKEAEIIYNEDKIAINNEEKDIRNDRGNENEQIAYNQLIVPLGKRSMLTFAEGSKIWVNAGTRVVYPVAFDKKVREIYVDGEAYLEVARNDNSPFVVKTKDLDVEVLGTSFNITAYEKDTHPKIVLVSGSVKINRENEKETILSPNEMFTFDQGKPMVKKVNPYDYISWKDGIYQYRSETLDVIIMRLSRYYGKKIECTPNVMGLKCSGKLDLKDDLSQVLNGIAKTAPISCGFENGEYIITNPKTIMPME